MDMNAEQHLAKYLDEYFYNRLSQESKYKSIIRISDKELQLKGVDVIVETQNNKYYIDEKAQLYYINQGLPTFAFEVDFINRNNELSPGWLYNNDLLTDYFFLIWPYATKNDLSKITVDDFTFLDCLMVRKKNIQGYLASCGWDKPSVLSKAKEIRHSNRRNKIEVGQKGFYFYFSEYKNYSEQPINIVIRKRILQKLAARNYKISKTEMKKI